MRTSVGPAPGHGAAVQMAAVVGCAALTALSAQLSFRVPFTPVPVTWQVFAVLFSGLALGSKRGFAAQTAYLAAGFAGAPVFALHSGGIGYLIGGHATTGYLLSYPIAAWLVGRLVESLREPTPAVRLRAAAAGLAVIYEIGCLWLGICLHMSLIQTVLQGAGWFVAWDFLKAVLAVAAAHVVANRINPRANLPM